MKASLLAVSLCAVAGAPASFADTSVESQIALLREALNASPNEGSTILRLAATFRGLGQDDEAARLERRAYELDPSLLLSRALPGTDGACTPNTGPDVIVGDLSDIGNYTSNTSVNGRLAFAIGTTSCNMGSQNVAWVASTDRHPVIGQSMYRILNGRIEHIGQSFLKHGFTALTQNLCCSCSGQGGSVLGVGCSDPYGSGLNGSQTNLGPKFEVNASNGVYTWPSALRTWNGSPNLSSAIFKRVQIRQDDFDPAMNPGAIYIGEAQYITQDDAQFNGLAGMPGGNGLNNASYRRFQFSWNATARSVTGSPSWVGSTQRQKPAIQAWQDFVPGVTLVNADVPNEGGSGIVGRFIVGYKVTDNGNGTWTYEYAVQNLNSHRSGASFSIALAGNPQITGMGFHDVDYHSGDGHNSTSANPVAYDGTDWAQAVTPTAATWSTQTFAQNPNANALRWGTLYNYRFTANQPPVATTATIGLFRSGSQPDPTVTVMGPACILAGDINGDNTVNFADLNIVVANFGTLYNFSHLNNVLANFGRSC